MTEPFLSEIRIFSFGFAPRGWALCNGQLLPISQNQALFSLLGTTYGGDGRVNFALPDLRGRTPNHVGQGHTLGERSGEEAHTVNINEMPSHVHAFSASSNNADSDVPTGRVLGASSQQPYQTFTSAVPMNAGMISSVGGSQPHTNMQPYLTLSFCIAFQGIFPSPT
ncbi:MAG: tail fiber protein [Anaerolineae bacterium]|nr:tail fiber protein [Anaerolineae bacterium]